MESTHPHDMMSRSKAPKHSKLSTNSIQEKQVAFFVVTSRDAMLAPVKTLHI